MNLEDLLGVESPKKESKEENVSVQNTDYIRYDPQIVGYPDTEMQEQIYAWAAEVLPIVGLIDVVDIGAGRGDFYKFLSVNKPNLNVMYDGFETNQILAKAGNENGVVNLHNRNFVANVSGQDQTLSQWNGWAFCIGSLNVNYGWEDKWEQFDLILNHSLKWVSQGVVFILNHYADDETYQCYPIEEMIPFLSETYPNIPYKLDYSKFDGIYNLTIYNNKFSE